MNQEIIVGSCSECPLAISFNVETTANGDSVENAQCYISGWDIDTSSGLVHPSCPLLDGKIIISKK